MPRRPLKSKPRGQASGQAKQHSDNPLGEESTENSSDYESPTTDHNQTSLSLRSRPRESANLSHRNQTSHMTTDMDLTEANTRNTRSSVGPNRLVTQPRPGPSRVQTRKQNNPRRLRPGVKALLEIKRYRNSVTLLIPRLPFGRLVREILVNSPRYQPGTRVQKVALLALHEAAEAYLVQFFEDSIRLANHAKRVTLMPVDMALVKFLRGNWDNL